MLRSQVEIESEGGGGRKEEKKLRERTKKGEKNSNRKHLVSTRANRLSSDELHTLWTDQTLLGGGGG